MAKKKATKKAVCCDKVNCCIDDNKKTALFIGIVVVGLFILRAIAAHANGTM